MVPNALESIATILRKHGVEFMVIGGMAETIFGSARVTGDIDLCYRRSPENFKRLAAALQEIGVRLRGAEDVPFTLDARSFEFTQNFTFVTNVLDLDLLAWVEPIGDFEKLLEDAELHTFDGNEYVTISLDDLIRVKRFLNRPKDQESLRHLLAIKQVREEMARNPHLGEPENPHPS